MLLGQSNLAYQCLALCFGLSEFYTLHLKIIKIWIVNASDKLDATVKIQHLNKRILKYFICCCSKVFKVSALV